MPKLETQASTSLHCLTGQGILDWVAMGNLLMMVPPSEFALSSRTRSWIAQSYLPFDPKASAPAYPKPEASKSQTKNEFHVVVVSLPVPGMEF